MTAASKRAAAPVVVSVPEEMVARTNRAPGHAPACDRYHTSTQEHDVINLGKGWARELDRHLKNLGKTFDECGLADLTAGERRLYLAVRRLRESEGKVKPKPARKKGGR